MMIGWCGICGYKARETWVSTASLVLYYTGEHSKCDACQCCMIDKIQLRSANTISYLKVSKYCNTRVVMKHTMRC